MNDIDLLEAFADYQRSGNRAARTISTRASILRSFASRQGVMLLDATVFHLRRDIGRENIAPSTRATTRATFLAFYGFIQSEELRADNPALRLPIVKVPPHRPRPYTQEQIDRLLSTGAYRRTRAMILLAAYQGLRASEIAAVHSDDLDLAAGTLKVFGKGGRTDYLPLHDTIRDLAPTMKHGWWFPARAGREGHIKGQSVSDLLTDGSDYGDWAKSAAVVVGGVTYDSYQHSSMTAELLVQQGQAIALPWRLDHLPPDAPPPDEDAPPGHDRPQDDGPIHPAPDEIRLIPGQRALAA